MNHKINDVGKLYNDSNDLYTRVVKEQADGIITELDAAITTLKNVWEGVDAGVQINNVVDVHNGMVAVRNALASLAKDSSAVAANYREIQRMNKGNIEELVPITVDEGKARIPAYEDRRDTINITPEALNAKNRLDVATQEYDTFKTAVERSYNEIMDNWTAGIGRNNAESAFNEFMANANKYKQILADVSESIATALKNYQM